MKSFLRTFILSAFLGWILIFQTSCICSTRSEKKVVHLLKGNDLGTFYSFLRDFGTNNDPDKVFMMTNGILRISGQHYGYLATKKDYSDYRLSAEFKWGQQTWAPRKTNASDSGILVHMIGKDQVWPKSVEAQIIEGGTGDILVVSGAYLTIDGVRKGPNIARFDRPGRNPWKDEKGFRGPHEIEKPRGEWNRMEVLCDGDRVEIRVNGHKTLEGTNAVPQAGKILVQSEGAEIFFRRLDVISLKR